MARMNLVIPHTFPQAEALGRIRSLLQQLKAQHGDRISNLQEEWHGNCCTFRFSVMGFAVSGTLRVGSSQVEINGDLPWAASLFRGKIEATIRERAATLLA